MTIIVFLIDTSASMFQRTYIGGRTTLLDVAKSAVETFVKIRQRSMDSRIDRYMLLTFEETPNNIKAGWKENLATFMNELKNLQCYSMTTMGVAVKQAFDILNINRMTTGIDTYGQGRCPFFLETSVIVLITDGGKMTTVNGVQEDFNLPMHSPVPGSEMTREPFRWDQRLFALVLRLTGTPAIERDTGLVPSDSSPIDAMCEVTGGRSYCITSHRMLNQCIDSLVQKVQNGVVINFEKIGPDPPPPQFDKIDDIKDDNNGNSNNSNEFDERGNNQQLQSTTSWHNCRKMIYVPKTNKQYCVGFWPIPESFWPEVTASVLPARSAHPNIKFTCTSSEPLVIENLPFDKYELEPSPLTQFILSRKQPKTCWQVFVANSYKNSEVGHPFGYLKASTNLSCVNLFVMPYNYPVLLPLLDELSKVHRWKPTNEWRTQFQNYLRTLPAYYAGPLRRALTRMGTPAALAQTLIPENSENLSYSVSNYLKRLKNQAKSELDKLCSEIILRQNTQNNLKINTEQIRVLPKIQLKKDLITHPLLIDKFNQQRDQIIDQSNQFLIQLDRDRLNINYKNPFDIPRHRLIQQCVRMCNNFLQSDSITLDQDSQHSLPISQMGNYQEYLKRQTPQLREIESAPVRQHMFGNPFKIDKRMMVDEADIDLVGSGSPGTGRNNKRPNPNVDNGGRIPVKRKPGPLPKNFSIRRPSGGMTPERPSPAPSPVPWYSAIDKDLPSFDERPNLVAVNGLDSPSSSERSRSPSPTLELPSYNTNDVNFTSRNISSNLHNNNNNNNNNNISNNNSNGNNTTNNNLNNNNNVNNNNNNNNNSSSSSSNNNNSINNSNNNVNNNATGALENITMNNTNDFYSNTIVNDEKQNISQILKEANSMIVNNQQHNQTEIKQKPIKVENREEIDNQNNEIRKHLHKLVRRPGKNFTELFDNIKTLKGNIDVQIEMIELIIKESLRFKRQHLADLLREYIRNLLNVDKKT